MTKNMTKNLAPSHAVFPILSAPICRDMRLSAGGAALARNRVVARGPSAYVRSSFGYGVPSLCLNVFDSIGAPLQFQIDVSDLKTLPSLARRHARVSEYVSKFR